MMGTRVLSFLSANGWVLNLGFISAGAYFSAGAANAVVASRIREVPTVADTPVAAVRPPSGGGVDNGGASSEFVAMAERNLFGLKREELSPQDVDAAAAEQASSEVGPGEFDPNDLRPCSVPASLRATIVAEGAPEWSIAVVYNNSKREAEVFTITAGNNQIADDATLVEIRSREIIVKRRDHFERCLAEGEGDDASPRGAIATRFPRARSRSTTDEPITGVSKVSDSEYHVEREEVDRVLSNLNQVATQARIVPSFKNGKANGFKLFSIKPGSIYSKIGLQNGDVIQKINGYDMNSPDKALEIYQKLRDATSISVELQRRGRPQSFNYSIR